MNLYQIDQQIQDAINTADPETGEIANIDALSALQMEKTAKQQGIAKFILHLENDEILIDNEIERLKELKHLNSRRQEWLRGYLKSSMMVDKVELLDFPTLKVRIKKNPPKLFIQDETLIPFEYFVVKEVKSIAKDAIKLAIAGGIGVPGAHIEQGTRLSIN